VIKSNAEKFAKEADLNDDGLISIDECVGMEKSTKNISHVVVHHLLL
jgi:hypothetical protein